MKYVVAGLVMGMALFAGGCPDRSVSAVEVVPEATFIKNIPVSVNLDILFVIDNSVSTRDKQTVFASNYPKFVEALDRFPTGRPNLHIGVVTSSIDIGVDGFGPQCHPATGQNGALQSASRDPLFMCTQPTADRFLSDITSPDGSRKVNYSGRLDEALSCISHAGDGGCGLEAPLEAMKRALDGSRPDNAGFLRRGAFLAVVFLTDEDDCSADQVLFEQPSDTVGKDDLRCALAAYRCDQTLSSSAPGTYTDCRVRHDSVMTVPADYAQFLLTLDGPSGVVVALIAGEPTRSITTGMLTLMADDGRTFTQQLAVEPTCSATINGNPAIGRPPLRLDEMLGVLGDHGLFRTVCQADYSGALADIGALLFKVTSPCLEGALDVRDTNLANPGLQPDCTVSDFTHTDGSLELETLVPTCRMIEPDQPDPAGVRPCWWVAPKPACLTQTQLELRVERSVPAAPDTTVRVSCALSEP